MIQWHTPSQREAGAGDMAVIPLKGDGTAVTYFSLNAGTILPVSVLKILDTGTTATNLIGLRD